MSRTRPWRSSSAPAIGLTRSPGKIAAKVTRPGQPGRVVQREREEDEGDAQHRLRGARDLHREDDPPKRRDAQQGPVGAVGRGVGHDGRWYRVDRRWRGGVPWSGWGSSTPAGSGSSRPGSPAPTASRSRPRSGRPCSSAWATPASGSPARSTGRRAQPRGAGGVLPPPRDRCDQCRGLCREPRGDRGRRRRAPSRPPPRLLLAVRPAAPRDPPDRRADRGRSSRLSTTSCATSTSTCSSSRTRSPSRSTCPSAWPSPRSSRRPGSRSSLITTTSPGSASASRPTASPTSSPPPSRRRCRPSDTWSSTPSRRSSSRRGRGSWPG